MCRAEPLQASVYDKRGRSGREGAKLARAYTDEMKKQALVFKIPVFNNMPETACAKPTVTGSPNNKLSGITIDGYSLTPTFNKDTEKYDLVVDSSVSSVKYPCYGYRLQGSSQWSRIDQSRKRNERS